MESGDEEKEHPASGMERPKRERERDVPSLSEIDSSNEFTIQDKEHQSRAFRSKDRIESVLKTYQARTENGLISEHDGVTTVLIPIQKGSFLVTLTPDGDETDITEHFLPDEIEVGEPELSKILEQ